MADRQEVVHGLSDVDVTSNDLSRVKIHQPI